MQKDSGAQFLRGVVLVGVTLLQSIGVLCFRQ